MPSERRVNQITARSNPRLRSRRAIAGGHDYPGDHLCAAFGVSKSTGAAKAKAVREALGISQMDPRWYGPSKMESNSLAWMILVNGFIVDVRSMPRDIQEAAYATGLIPYLPEAQPRQG